MANFTEGLVIALQGILIVFGVLVILMLVLMLMKVFFYKDPKKAAKAKPAPEAVPAQATPEQKTSGIDENELIAVMAAAIAAAGGSGRKSSYNLQVRSIRRAGSNTPVWNAVSRRENLDAQL